MALTKEDLYEIGSLMESKLEPIRVDLTNTKNDIKEDLNEIVSLMGRELEPIKADITNIKNDISEIKEQIGEIDDSIGIIADWAESVSIVTKVPFAGGSTT